MHPVVFHQVLDLLDAAGWQVRQEEKHLEILVAAPGDAFDPDGVVQAIRAALTTVGALPPEIHVRTVDAIPTGASGKRPLIVALPPEIA